MSITRKYRTTWSKCIAVACAVIMLGLAARGEEDPWWDGAWPTRKKITIDTTEPAGAVTEPIGGATVLLRLFTANWPSTAKEDLSDIRFVGKDGKTAYPYHVEKIDSLLGEAFVWVKIPEVRPAGKTEFYMYFGSTDAKAAKAEDAKGSYDGDTMLVFHFGESGQPPVDVTKNGNVAEAEGGKLEGAQIGGGVIFNGRIGIPVAPSPSLLWTDGATATLSMWIKPTQPTGVLVTRKDGNKSFAIGLEKGTPYVEISGQRGAASQGLETGSWTHIAVICEPSKTTLFVNGAPSGALGVGLPALNTPLLIGAATAGGADGFTGELDEFQVHRIARSPGFVTLAANSQGGDKWEKTIVVGVDETPTDWLSWLKTGYFGVIIANLTHDGWAVIILLAIMSVLSWYIMFSKVRYLNGLAKGNDIFMKQWRHVANDLTVLDDNDVEKSKTLGGRVTKDLVKHLRRSSVYRIYHIGVEEIRHRLATDRQEGVRRGLAGRSIQAIRAALDGGLVRETQRINKLIVILTICISGGPFLGLLGTVVGVMITFAAVAAAGEVNVNAIAPGIAAALLATVAGLAVAIPALFGYNYILSRVKDAKDDMHIFIDEFVTKMAEFYKEKNND